MMPASGVVTVLAGSARPGRCTRCRQPIVWATAARTVSSRAKSLPFDRVPIAGIAIRHTDERTGLHYERWPAEYLHLVTCPGRRRATQASGVEA
jgi:hypothetical protein